MKILIIGGDSRNEYLYTELTQSGYEVDKFALGENSQKELETNSYKFIVGPIPFTTDNIHLYTPLCNRSIHINDFLQSLNNSSLLMAGSIPDNQSINCAYIDLTKNEWLYDKNIISTGEGILQLLLNNIEYTIDDSNILVTGYGKVGKSISTALLNLNARVSIYSTNTMEQEEIAGKFQTGQINDLTQYDIIINTIPSIIFTERNLNTINRGTFLLDVASSPGGIDIEHAEKNNIRFVKAPGLPGKKAPKSVAKAMKCIIVKYIEENS